MSALGDLHRLEAEWALHVNWSINVLAGRAAEVASTVRDMMHLPGAFQEHLTGLNGDSWLMRRFEELYASEHRRLRILARAEAERTLAEIPADDMPGRDPFALDPPEPEEPRE